MEFPLSISQFNDIKNDFLDILLDKKYIGEDFDIAKAKRSVDQFLEIISRELDVTERNEIYYYFIYYNCKYRFTLPIPGLGYLVLFGENNDKGIDLKIQLILSYNFHIGLSVVELLQRKGMSAWIPALHSYSETIK